MKRFILILSLLLMFIPASAVLSADDAAVLSLSGEDTVTQNRYFEISVSIEGKDLNNLKGTISYDPKALLFYRIPESSKLSGFTYSLNNSNGKISFTVSSENTSIIGSATLFTVRFITRDDYTGETSITPENVVSISKKVEQIVANQKEIDDALTQRENQFAENATEVVIPDPIYEDKITLVETPVNVSAKKVEIIDQPSDNSLLKSFAVTDGRIEPSFNKFTLNYDLYVLEDNSSIQINALPEDPDSKVEISNEVNNQIFITVTSENDTVTSYIFKVHRQATIPKDPVTPPNTPARELSGATFWLLIGLAVVSASIMGIGGYYIYLGTKES